MSHHISETVQYYDQAYHDRVIGSRICAFKINDLGWPWTAI